MVKRENIIGFVLIVVIAGAVFALGSFAPPQGKDAQIDVASSDADAAARRNEKLTKYPLALEIVKPAGFINTEDGQPITIQEYIGEKVILLDIWTYSCINCIRTMPYLRAWYETYADEGLLIIGIHSPEFDFEKDIENVRDAVAANGVTWPVVLDNDKGTWNAYGNRYWPRKYLIDIDGFVVYDHIGEGAYEETEAKIREALVERAEVLGERTGLADNAQPTNVEALDLMNPRTPEIYLGAWRNELLGNGQQLIQGSFSFSVPPKVDASTLYLGGEWDVAYEYAANTAGGATIVLPYQASKVFMVLAPSDPKTPVKARVLLDEQPITEADADEDVIFGDGDPYILIDADRMYRIVETAGGWGKHLFELIIDEPGLEAYTFAFG